MTLTGTESVRCIVQIGFFRFAVGLSGEWEGRRGNCGHFQTLFVFVDCVNVGYDDMSDNYNIFGFSVIDDNV